MNIAQFAFPLNVYARMLELEEGRVDYLHYGLFEHVDEPVWRAQERATRLLWRALPPPCRVLEVGIGVGTTLRKLGEAGYRAFGITPDAAQLGEVRARHGDAVQVAQSTLETLHAHCGPWDLMLLQESAQYIEPLALFEAADRLLAPVDATIVVMDEFALRRRGPADTGLHDLDAFIALAQRMGWTLADDQDVSASASGTVGAICRLVQRQRETLLRELPVTGAQLDTLIEAGRRYQALYDEGIYGYRLLRLQRRQRPALRLGAVALEQAPAMRALFERIFERPMSAPEWQWKYGDGRGHAAGLWRGDQLLAHYGGATRAVHMDGQVVAACQIGDVMVSPDANAGLGRQGALQQVSATLLEQQIGWGRQHIVGYGFPNARALRVAQRLGLYAPVDRVLQLDWPAPPAHRWRDHLVSVESVDIAGVRPDLPIWLTLQELWQAMCGGLPAALLPVRDPAWLRHRYGLRPDVTYRVYLLRRRIGGRAIGAFVLRVHDDHVELMDLIGPPNVLASLVRAARLATQATGRACLHAWITASHVHWIDDPADPARRTDLDVQVPTCVHTPGPTPDSLRERWFLMAGDTDFR
ncbi:MAG: GNAT family N-acetyltransferase [Rubrivivax sp.]|nr:GNAT family N-acetyltransferase [Rubrivivax sp.]